MTIELLANGVVALRGRCPSADAETLFAHLSAGRRSVDWQDCEMAHAAVIQVLLATRADLIGSPRGEFLRRFVEPALKAQ